MISILWPPFLAALACSLVLTPFVRGVARRSRLVATPVADRWHQLPTPLLGGIAIFGGFLFGGSFALRAAAHAAGHPFRLADRSLFGIILASSLMFVVGLADDKLHLRPSSKLIAQVAAGAIVMSVDVIYPVSPWIFVNVLFTMFWFIGITNALNLLDNMDGVAVGVAGVAAIFLGVTFSLDGVIGMAGLCFALAGALLGFLPFNFRPASIFMGDSGSLFIGSLLAALGAAYPSQASASLISVLFVPAVIVIIPILDTVLVTVARTLAGRPISVGGRDHTSHRLVAMGLSQRQVALLLYAFAIGGGVLAIVLRRASPQLALPIGGVFLVALLIGAAYLGKLHAYEPSERERGSVSVLVSNLFHKRRAFEVLIDLLLFGAAYQFAYLLRWDANIPPDQAVIFARTLAIAVVAKSVGFGLLGVYRGHWHQLSVPDLPRVAAGTAVGSLLTVATLVLIYPAGGFSRGVLTLDAILVLMLAAGARISFNSLDAVRPAKGIPAAIYGAGKAGEMVVRELLSNPEMSLRPIGFLDDDRARKGRLVLGLPVFGGPDELPTLVRDRDVRTVIVGSRLITHEALLNIEAMCQMLDIDLLKLHVEFRSVISTDAIRSRERPSGADHSTKPGT